MERKEQFFRRQPWVYDPEYQPSVPPVVSRVLTPDPCTLDLIPWIALRNFDLLSLQLLPP